MVILFRCNEENLIMFLKTEMRPMVGDLVLIKDKEYVVTRVAWFLEDSPGQSGLVTYIKRKEI